MNPLQDSHSRYARISKRVLEVSIQGKNSSAYIPLIRYPRPIGRGTFSDRMTKFSREKRTASKATLVRNLRY